MKYTVLINQAGISEAGYADKTDYSDWALIDYIDSWINNPRATTRDGRVWINYRYLMAQMPLLGTKSKSSITNRLARLQSLGLISIDHDQDKRVFAALTPKCHDIINFKAIPGVLETGRVSNKKNTNVSNLKNRGVLETGHSLGNQDKTINKDTPPNPPGGEVVRDESLPCPTQNPKPTKFDAAAIDLPEWLDRDTWAEWCADRKARRKPITALAATKQIAQLADYRQQGHLPGDVIAHSIASSYQGLFPPRTNHATSRSDQRRETPFERSLRQGREIEAKIQNGTLTEWLHSADGDGFSDTFGDFLDEPFGGRRDENTQDARLIPSAVGALPAPDDGIRGRDG